MNVTIQLNKHLLYKKVYLTPICARKRKERFLILKRINAESGSRKLEGRWLITKEKGAKNFAIRLFEMEAGRNSPFILLIAARVKPETPF
jgi:hypothetical protein